MAAASTAATPIAKKPSKKKRRDNIFHQPFQQEEPSFYSYQARFGTSGSPNSTARKQNGTAHVSGHSPKTVAPSSMAAHKAGERDEAKPSQLALQRSRSGVISPPAAKNSFDRSSDGGLSLMVVTGAVAPNRPSAIVMMPEAIGRM